MLLLAASRVFVQDGQQSALLWSCRSQHHACQSHSQQLGQVCWVYSFLLGKIVVEGGGNDELPLGGHDSGVAHFVAQHHSLVLHQMHEVRSLVYELFSIDGVLVLEPVLSGLDADIHSLIVGYQSVGIVQVNLFQQPSSLVVLLLCCVDLRHLLLEAAVFVLEAEQSGQQLRNRVLAQLKSFLIV